MTSIIRRLLQKIKYRRNMPNAVDSDWRGAATRVLDARPVYGLNDGRRAQDIVVSLTTIPTRFEMLHLVVGSMLAQTVRPDRIVVWLDEGVEVEQMPRDTLSLRDEFDIDLEVRPGDLRPHKKYYYAFKEYPDALIVTIDDDLIYPSDMIEELLATHRRFKDCVVAARAHRVIFDHVGKVLPYNDWEWGYSRAYEPRLDLLATGTGGVLYPTHCMHDDLLDMALIQELSISNDDLWLKVMQVLVGTRVVLCDQRIRKRRADVPDSQRVNLNASNVHQNLNDNIVANLTHYYGLTPKMFGMR